MQFLANAVADSPEFSTIKSAIQSEKFPLIINGLSDVSVAHISYSILKNESENKSE